MYALFLCLFSAWAAEPTEHDSAVLVSPLGPAVAVVANVTGVPIYEGNVRGHHMLSDRLGWSAQVDIAGGKPEGMDVVNATLRTGPRLPLRTRGLEDWSLTPFAMVGYTSLSAASQHLAHYGVLGGGLEIAHTWVWKRFAMDLGLAAYSVGAVGYTAPAEALREQRPLTIFPIKPSLTWSLGYAF